MVGLTDSSTIPIGFMAVTRTERDAPFTREEEAAILSLRDQAERALVAFELSEDWSRPLDGILDDLTAALPVPALLFNESGVVWMNREAELRLGVVALNFAGITVHGAAAHALDELLEHARRELDGPGTWLKRSTARPPSWLFPGEAVVVRRIERRDSRNCALVCLCAPRPLVAPREHGPQLDRFDLTAREAEIVELAVKGHSVLGVASRLNIAESTVCTHLKRIYRKLGGRSRAELAWRVAAPNAPDES